MGRLSIILATLFLTCAAARADVCPSPATHRAGRVDTPPLQQISTVPAAAGRTYGALLVLLAAPAAALGLQLELRRRVQAGE